MLLIKYPLPSFQRDLNINWNVSNMIYNNHWTLLMELKLGGSNFSPKTPILHDANILSTLLINNSWPIFMSSNFGRQIHPGPDKQSERIFSPKCFYLICPSLFFYLFNRRKFNAIGKNDVKAKPVMQKVVLRCTK